MKAKPDTKNTQDEAAINLAKGLGLFGLSKEQQAEIGTLLMGVLSFRITAQLWSKLSEEQKEKMQNMLEDSADEEFLDYVEENVEEFPELVEAVTQKTVEDFMSKRQSLKK